MSEWGKPSPEEEAAMDRVVMMEGGGQRGKCPKCGDVGLHPYASGAQVECRSCGHEFPRGMA